MNRSRQGIIANAQPNQNDQNWKNSCRDIKIRLIGLLFRMFVDVGDLVFKHFDVLVLVFKVDVVKLFFPESVSFYPFSVPGILKQCVCHNQVTQVLLQFSEGFSFLEGSVVPEIWAVDSA